jgi:hypothetical protein
MNTGFISKASPIENFQKELDQIKKQASEAPNPYAEPQDVIA